MRNGAAELAVPGGYWVKGARYRDVAVRRPNGEDEAFLHETRHSGALACRVTALLARLVQRVGPIDEVTPETIGGLTVGAREALLLHARRLALGNRLSSVVRCPDDACGALMDLDLDVHDLLTAPYTEAAPEHETRVETAAGAYRVRFRLPTGADQEEAAREATLERGAAVILRRTVGAIERAGHPVDEIPPEVAEHVSACMAELDPQAQLSLRSACPSCGKSFNTALDTATYFFQEMSARFQRMFRDVHLLARAYHWTEPAILALPFEHRRAYVRLIEEEGTRGEAR